MAKLSTNRARQAKREAASKMIAADQLRACELGFDGAMTRDAKIALVKKHGGTLAGQQWLRKSFGAGEYMASVMGVEDRAGKSQADYNAAWADFEAKKGDTKAQSLKYKLFAGRERLYFMRILAAADVKSLAERDAQAGKGVAKSDNAKSKAVNKPADKRAARQTVGRQEDLTQIKNASADARVASSVPSATPSVTVKGGKPAQVIAVSPLRYDTPVQLAAFLRSQADMYAQMLKVNAGILSDSTLCAAEKAMLVAFINAAHALKA